MLDDVTLNRSALAYIVLGNVKLVLVQCRHTQISSLSLSAFWQTCLWTHPSRQAECSAGLQLVRR